MSNNSWLFFFDGITKSNERISGKMVISLTGDINPLNDYECKYWNFINEAINTKYNLKPGYTLIRNFWKMEEKKSVNERFMLFCGNYKTINTANGMYDSYVFMDNEINKSIDLMKNQIEYVVEGNRQMFVVHTERDFKVGFSFKCEWFHVVHIPSMEIVYTHHDHVR